MQCSYTLKIIGFMTTPFRLYEDPLFADTTRLCCFMPKKNKLTLFFSKTVIRRFLTKLFKTNDIRRSLKNAGISFVTRLSTTDGSASSLSLSVRPSGCHTAVKPVLCLNVCNCIQHQTFYTTPQIDHSSVKLPSSAFCQTF